MPDGLTQLLVAGGLFAAAWFMWWFVPRFTDWVTPGEPLWRIWFQRALAAAVFAVPAICVMVSAFK